MIIMANTTASCTTSTYGTVRRSHTSQRRSHTRRRTNRATDAKVSEGGRSVGMEQMDETQEITAATSKLQQEMVPALKK